MFVFEVMPLIQTAFLDKKPSVNKNIYINMQKPIFEEFSRRSDSYLKTFLSVAFLLFFPTGHCQLKFLVLRGIPVELIIDGTLSGLSTYKLVYKKESSTIEQMACIYIY